MTTKTTGDGAAPHDSATKLHVDVGGWPTVSGSSVTLILEPSGEREDGIPCVYTFGHVGPGCPERVFHGRHYQICSVSTEAVPEELERIVREHEDEILARDATYLGAEWDGHNHRGRWDLSEDEQYGYDEGALARDVADCPCYWDAADYLSVETMSVLDEAMRDASLEDAARREVEQAQTHGAWLDADAVEEWLTEQLAESVEVGSVVEEHLPDLDEDETDDSLEMLAYVGVDVDVAGETYRVGCSIGLPESLHGSARAAGTGVQYGPGYPTAWWVDASDHQALPAIVDRGVVLDALREAADRLWDEVEAMREESDEAVAS